MEAHIYNVRRSKPMKHPNFCKNADFLTILLGTVQNAAGGA
jgi:hypothetical protein